MVSRAYIFLTIGRQLARVATAIADRVQESTPEERAEVARHVAAIYRILRDATERCGDARDFPMLMLGPTTANDNQTRTYGAASKMAYANSATLFAGTGVT